jgi:hypothetical protein
LSLWVIGEYTSDTYGRNHRHLVRSQNIADAIGIGGSSVCRHSDGFPQEPDYDLCQDWRSEVARNEKNPKINGVEWLRSCQIG